jgi:hypothetical protein
MKKKRFYAHAFFSVLVIGLGQVIKGDSTKGLKWMLVFYLIFPFAIYASLLLNAYLFIAVLGTAVIVYPVFWLYNVVDALNHKV